MTIGEALLNLRKQLGLTQTEMAANVVSTSFYSKVERNIHDIGTNDLLQILNKHQINATYFFENLNDKENISEDIMNRISVAFEQKSKDKLLKIKDSINTDTAKEISIKRHKFMEDFLNEFLDEWNGEK